MCISMCMNGMASADSAGMYVVMCGDGFSRCAGSQPSELRCVIWVGELCLSDGGQCI